MSHETKNGVTLKHIDEYSSEEEKAMKEVLSRFDENMDEYNKWWRSKNDTSINSWIKARAELKKEDKLALSKEEDRIEIIKKLIDINKEYRSNWEYLSKEERDQKIIESYDRLLNKRKKEIDEQSTPKLSKDENNKLNKVDEKNPKSKPNHKLARDFTGLDKAVKKRQQNNTGLSSGSSNDAIREPVPYYNKSNAEKIMEGFNNSWIVMGRDRPGSLASGYGGKAHTQSGAIDIVVGRMGHKPREMDSKGRKVKVDNNFTTDSARIYISQKTDIDKNFNLASGKVGIANMRSGIGIKADHVRLIAREGIKLITRTDLKNSQGGDIKSVSGIDLIAGNDDKDLQPLVKGQNVKEALNKLSKHLEYLNGIVFNILEAQMQLNEQISLHYHETPFGPTLPSYILEFSAKQTMLSHYQTCEMDIKSHLSNINNWRGMYLQKSGRKYIMSRYNNVN